MLNAALAIAILHLISKVHLLHLPDHLYLFLKSYLSERYFQVKFDDELSDNHPIRAGVQHGSVLGPLLYLLYIADVQLTQETPMATFAVTLQYCHQILTPYVHLKNFSIILTYPKPGWNSGELT